LRFQDEARTRRIHQQALNLRVTDAMPNDMEPDLEILARLDRWREDLTRRGCGRWQIAVSDPQSSNA